MSELRITGFEILGKLGEGGMASVWKARQISLDRIVAIKILSTRLASDPGDIRRFQSEAQAAAKLKHPGVVQVYDANVENGLYYFVMEYVGGYTVGDWVRRKGRLEEKDAVLVAEAVADALRYAWENQRIIHCDIKPDNVMVDADGSVKVADLGLARTISAMRAQQGVAEEVLGTPAYISPEQARGDLDLDCRADIYSAGAMLYHLVTGKLLFEGHTDAEVMDLQIAGAVEDAGDLNPHVSRSLCWLIEKMLAKDRKDRPADWPGVHADLARVKKGHSPHHRLAEGVASTMKRSRHRTHVDVPVPSPTVSLPEKSGFPLRTIAVAGGVLVAGGLLALMVSRLSPPVAILPPLESTSSVPVAPVQAATNRASEADAQELFEYVAKTAAENPAAIDVNLRNFERVVKQTQGTKYSLMAEDEIRKIRQRLKEEIDGVMHDLEQRAAPLIENGRYAEAADLYGKYDGVAARETHARRTELAGALRGRQWQADDEKSKAEERRAQKYTTTRDALVAKLLADGPAAALPLADAAVQDEDLTAKREEFTAIRQVIAGAADMDSRVLESFRAQKGKQVTIQTTSGERTFVINDVVDGKILGAQDVQVGGATAFREQSVALKDLATRERLARMGSEEQPDVALAKGLMALNMKSYDYARKYFAKTSESLREGLLRAVDRAESSSADEEAQKVLVRLLQQIGLPITEFDRDAILKRIAAQNPAANNAAARESIADYRLKYGATQFGKDAEPVLAALLGTTPASETAPPRRKEPAERRSRTPRR